MYVYSTRCLAIKYNDLPAQVKDKDYFPVVVVANKCDLEYERQVQPHGEFQQPVFLRQWLTSIRGPGLGQTLQCAMYRDIRQAAGQRR